MPVLDLGHSTIIGHCPTKQSIINDATAIAACIHDINHPLAVVVGKRGPSVAVDPVLTLGSDKGLPVHAWLPAGPVSGLGDRAFCTTHGLRYSYMAGAMANGIASVELCVALAGAGMLGSFGAGGLSLERTRAAIHTIRAAIGQAPFAVNLIHAPHEPAHEEAVVDLLLEERVRLIEASAYLGLTAAVVRYRLTGIRELPDGSVHCPNRIIAKASRVEVATRWLSPPPAKLVAELLKRGVIDETQAALASRVPMAEDLTAEADSGGHTDNRAAIALYPTFLSLAERLTAEHGYPAPLRIGAAGGISTPASAAAAFGMGLAYLCTGSVNQACLESGSCDHVRAVLAEVEQADVCMAPAADMFEMGVKLQVIRRGTMFPMRAAKLWRCYEDHARWEDIPQTQREEIEKNIFRRSFAEVWADTEAFWQRREPDQAERGRQDPKRRLALCFRWYLGMASHWANRGDPERRLDYQIWAGPAMGAFNEWTKGSFLADPAQRTATCVARNLLVGAARQQRLTMLRAQGIRLDSALGRIVPVEESQLLELVP